MTQDDRWTRYAALAGIVAVLLFVAGGFLAGSPPQPGDPAGRIRDFYIAHRWTLLFGAYLTGLAASLLLWFLASVRAVLRRAEGGEGVLSTTMYAGAIVTTVVTLVGTAVSAALAFNAQRGDAAVQTLFDASNLALVFVFFPWALTTASAGVVLIRTGVLPRWLGWAGLLLAAVFLLSAAGLGMTSGAFAAGSYGSFAAFFLGMAWFVVLAALIWRRPGAGRASA